VAGELYLGGRQVARGYAGRPGLTAERFVPDAFSGMPGARLYRTGDRVRHLEDGSLVYLGRMDEQVKVRGVRVEPGEVEAALLEHPAVRAGAVVAREEAPGDWRLAAYVVGEVETEELRAYLRRTLPDTMVPGAFVSLPALPLTPSGKVDRRALPAPTAAAKVRYVAPRTESEQRLAEVWSELLNGAAVGAEDDFFDLGGHSLLATRLVSRIREAFGAELPLRAVFDHPTLESMAAAVEARLPKLADAAAGPVEGERVYPASAAQRRLWVLDRLEPGSPAFTLAGGVRLRGALDAAALERALTAVFARHAALRTRIEARDGEPVQVVSPPSAVALEVADRPALDDAGLAALAAEEAALPFALARGPLFRARLVRIARDDHALLWALHQAAGDARSAAVVLADLAALYQGEAAGSPAVLPPLSVQYGEVAERQAVHAAGPAYQEGLRWWAGTLRGAPALLDIPTDRPRAAIRVGRAATVTVPLAAGAAALQTLAGQGDGDALPVLLAAFHAVLSRWSGQGDVVIGTPVDDRPAPELAGVAGPFAGLLAIRADESDDPSFSAFAARVAAALRQARAHADVPFEAVVDAVQPLRSQAHTPVFQVTLALDEAPAAAVEFAGLVAEPLADPAASAPFDLALTLRPRGDGLEADVRYAAELFDAETVQRLAAHVGRVLAQAAANPDVRLSGLELMDAAERSLVVDEWNCQDAEYPDDWCIHHRFQAQAARTPGAVAVTFGDERLTYAALNERANRLAHHLVALGVRPESRVGLCLERGIETIVSILAVLKAGGAYVPLDPAYPAERLAFMLGDSGIGILVTQSSARGALPAAEGVHVVSVDEDAERIAAERADDPDAGATPESLAYVIYTSGSTGTPKGTLVEHRNVARLFTATDAWFGFGESDVWTLFHSYAFDFSVWEMWGALLYGGRLVVVPFEVSRDPEAFHALLQREGVTVLNQTPSAFRPLIRADQARGGELALRCVVFGGEALEPATLRDWVRRHGIATPRLVNMYGITETTVHVTYRPLAEEDVFGGGGSPIGVRIPDLATYVLDPHGRPAPVGVPGELYVGGGGVARGYLGRPSLTAQRFVPDPFSGVPGARMYRSGDLARWRESAAGNGTEVRENGTALELEYLGRIDHQVKVRGFRIEPGEIEAVLRAHPAVRDAVVLPRGEGDETRLVAWIVYGDGAAGDAAALREHAGSRLPDYMVPAAFVALDALPLTRNGKVDRAALPDPASGAAGDAYVAPRTPTEEVLAGIWAALLGMERVGAEDGFFALGGHSLLATR
ncbi:MAG: amino acid adenylation domain-containing protein, partial [Gemmatimonadetes bacterium]|nr:amino acid adenylation domain-containing protein [Gemmatimonadota bacterium]